MRIWADALLDFGSPMTRSLKASPVAPVTIGAVRGVPAARPTEVTAVCPASTVVGRTIGLLAGPTGMPAAEAAGVVGVVGAAGGGVVVGVVTAGASMYWKVAGTEPLGTHTRSSCTPMAPGGVTISRVASLMNLKDGAQWCRPPRRRSRR